MLCSNCGHDNPSDNRFCGMCGTKLEPMAVPQRELAPETYADLVRERVGTQSTPEQVSQRSEPIRSDSPRSRETQPRNDDNLHPSQRTFEPEPLPQWPRREKAVTGPSFLNLEVPETPASQTESQPGQTISGPSFLGLADEGRYNIDYLLEEEHKESHWRLWLVLIILTLFGMMAWLQVRHSGLDVASLMQRLKQAKLSTTEEQTHPKDVTSDTGSSADVAKSPQPAQNAAGQSNTTQTNAASAPTAGASASDQGKASNPPAAATDAGNISPATAAPDQSATQPKSDATGATKFDTSTQPDKSAATQPEASADRSPAGESAAASDSAVKNQPSTVAKNTPPKKPAASVVDSEAKAARARDAQTAGLISSGEKYLYGRGVPANCERAISYLRKASDMGNAKGSSHLGAMYATGQCLPMDRVRAYKYFAQALHQDSSNMYFQRNLEMLWNEMTPDEKQQALARTPAQ